VVLEVDISTWSLDVHTDERLRLTAFLDDEERARATRFVHPEFANRWSVARGRLRELLGARLNIPPADLHFRYGRHGKPELDSVGSLTFNLSHTGDLAALAIAPRGEIGVDIELMRPLHEPVAELYFSHAENWMLRDHPQYERQAAFYRCWTCKEAFVKAIATGLATPLHAFDVSFMFNEPPRLLRLEGIPEEPARWTFWQFQPRPDCMGAVAVRAPHARFRLNTAV